MMKSVPIFVFYTLLLSVSIGMIKSRPQNIPDNNHDLENLDHDLDEMRSSYYELPAPATYSGVPLDRLQMLIAQYRPTPYLRTAGWGNGMNELFRTPESKRQVRYRQCYFNPISCFKK